VRLLKSLISAPPARPMNRWLSRPSAGANT
jgi:hypothetical protein